MAIGKTPASICNLQYEPKLAAIIPVPLLTAQSLESKLCEGATPQDQLVAFMDRQEGSRGYLKNTVLLQHVGM